MQVLKADCEHGNVTRERKLGDTRIEQFVAQVKRVSMKFEPVFGDQQSDFPEADRADR